MFVKCACTNCQGHIEFDAINTGLTVTCPHCGIETMLNSPQTENQAIVSVFPSTTQSQQQPFGLPVITDKSLRSIKVKSSDGINFYRVNLVDYTCTCPSFFKDHAHSPPKDFGRLCKHICGELNRHKLYSTLDPMCKVIAEERFGVYPGRFDKDANGNPIYITGVSPAGWINIFALKRKDGVNFFRFGYNLTEERWAYGSAPKAIERILYAEVEAQRGLEHPVWKKNMPQSQNLNFTIELEKRSGFVTRVLSKFFRILGKFIG